MNKEKYNKVEEAFKRLQTTVYYDKTNLFLREKVAILTKQLMDGDNSIIVNITNVLLSENDEAFRKWLDKIKLLYFPKKVSPITCEESQDDSINNVITNKPYCGDLDVKRLMVFADMPIELYIIDMLWVMEFGPEIDGMLSNCCFGNRLNVEKKQKLGNDVLQFKSQRFAFKKYIQQYNDWWENGIKTAERHLHEENEDIAILSLDITDYYHSVRYNPEELRKELKIDTENQLWQLHSRIYEKYCEKAKESEIIIFNRCKKGELPLPLSLNSSPIIANWYLKEFDEYIQHELNCLYYGRYVDDMLFVMRRSERDVATIRDVVNVYFNFLSANNEGTNISFNIPDNTPKLTVEQNSILKKHTMSLQIQNQKLYYYEFDKDTPSLLLDKFLKEQKERSSEYRFLSDAEDSHLSTFDDLQLDLAFDFDDDSKARFKPITENKFQLAVFLTKLTKRIISKGPEGYINEVDKVFKYFKGKRIIDYYAMWERVFTLFVVSQNTNYVDKFERVIKLEINKIKKVLGADKNIDILNKTLNLHLSLSKNMAISLHLANFDKDQLTFLNGLMVRSHLNKWPIQQFIRGYDEKGVFMEQSDLKKLDYTKYLTWLPYPIKFYEFVLAELLTGKLPPDYEELFKQWKQQLKIDKDENVVELVHKCQNNSIEIIEEHKIKGIIDNGFCKKKSKIVVALAQMDVDDEILDTVLQERKINAKRKEVRLQVLDKVSTIGNVDVFIMPELSLPIGSLLEFCRYSANKQIAFVSGMEYIVNKKDVYNMIIECIPFKHGSTLDAIPYVRLKQHYAPKEIQNIEKHRLKIPDNKLVNTRSALCHWHGHVFASYYCYELTNISLRTEFLTKVDAIYAPVFNKDTYYYNNIIKSMVRDMHCYFIQANVSKYGWSQIAQPTKHDIMQPLFVKGGTNSNNPIVVLSGELDINGLRQFQEMSIFGQLDKKEEFKSAPPIFFKDDTNPAKSRMAGGRLLNDENNKEK